MNAKLLRLVTGIIVVIMLLVSACSITPNFGSGNPVTETPRVSGFETVVVTGGPPDSFAHLGTSWSDFSLSFDPTQWDTIPFQPDWPGLEALAHRSLTGCRITPNIPVGLGDEWRSENGSIDLNGRQFQVKRFFQSGELKFVVYFGFINQPYEGAVEVHFTTDQKACLLAANALFAATEVNLPAHLLRQRRSLTNCLPNRQYPRPLADRQAAGGDCTGSYRLRRLGAADEREVSS